MHKRMFLLTIFFLTSINLHAQHFNPEFSKLRIREANPDHDFGEIKMVKSLHDGKIVVSYCVAQNDLFYICPVRKLRGFEHFRHFGN